jgi:uncharacterized membrane protein YbhN (UPF0104 family)
MRTVLVNGFRVAITVTILWWLIRRIDLGLVWDQVRGTNLLWLAYAFALSLGQRVTRSVNWGQLLEARGVRLPGLQWRLLQLYFAGGFLGALFPSSVTADAIRMVLARRLLGENMGTLAATALLLNAVTWVAACVVGFSGLALLLLQGEYPRELTRVSIAFLVISAGLAIAYSLLVVFQSRLVASMRGWRRPLHRIRQFLRRLLSALVVHGDQQGSVRRTIVYAIGAQLFGVLSLGALGQAVGMDVPTAVYLVAIPLSGVASLLPASVLGFGAVQVVHVVLFRSFGASEATALAVSTLYTVKAVGLQIVIGAAVLLCSDLGRPGFRTSPDNVSARSPDQR